MNWDSIKSILKLSIPLIISQLGLFFVQLSDTVMVGQIGSRDLAAISFGGNVYFFIYISSKLLFLYTILSDITHKSNLYYVSIPKLICYLALMIFLSSI